MTRDVNNCQAADTFQLSEPPQISALAGNDITICGQSYYTLNADSPAYGNGYWNIINGNGLTHILDSTYFASFVDSLQIGDNTFLWTVTDGKCSSSDVLIITAASQVNAFAGSDKTDLCGDVYILDAAAPQFGFGYWQVLSGNGTLVDSSIGITPVNGLSVGVNTFKWTIVNGGCIGEDSLIVVRLDSMECLSQIELPSAFSPNGDTHNDYFVIKGIEDYINNTLTVYDRWGVEVFSKSKYHNEWKGENKDGRPIADGTYFYLLKIDGIRNTYKGFIDVRR